MCIGHQCSLLPNLGLWGGGWSGGSRLAVCVNHYYLVLDMFFNIDTPLIQSVPFSINSIVKRTFNVYKSLVQNSINYAHPYDYTVMNPSANIRNLVPIISHGLAFPLQTEGT